MTACSLSRCMTCWPVHPYSIPVQGTTPCRVCADASAEWGGWQAHERTCGSEPMPDSLIPSANTINQMHRRFVYKRNKPLTASGNYGTTLIRHAKTGLPLVLHPRRRHVRVCEAFEALREDSHDDVRFAHADTQTRTVACTCACTDRHMA